MQASTGKLALLDQPFFHPDPVAAPAELASAVAAGQFKARADPNNPRFYQDIHEKPTKKHPRQGGEQLLAALGCVRSILKKKRGTRPLEPRHQFCPQSPPRPDLHSMLRGRPRPPALNPGGPDGGGGPGGGGGGSGGHGPDGGGGGGPGGAGDADEPWAAGRGRGRKRRSGAGPSSAGRGPSRGGAKRRGRGGAGDGGGGAGAGGAGSSAGPPASKRSRRSG
ncbi:hypothetical protein HYH03_007753 [Edaphochlamys debaryana]|uniref:Uncharacterized protein n=1 Tax=Edaphochlamys debaryana TaxID=47281 RepID=A0A835Y2N4_9CHLO|nr:hypothetical protein HYH03_007753 [Edaphochlamys debaryana]|eukprot:KAG2494114.1 hypothetical protein HYH03_007753 [Edaphochlamys debaryana]